MNDARPLTRAQLRGLEQDLRRERARLRRSIETRMGADELAPTPHSVLRQRTQTEDGLAVALETRTVHRYQALDSALRRLEAGTYGRCTSCHALIAYARLLVMPEATYCIRCGAGA